MNTKIYNITKFDEHDVVKMHIIITPWEYI